MIDLELAQQLSMLENHINGQIDALIPKRDNANGKDKYPYRYVVRKLENALGEIHKAQDKIEEIK